MIHDVYHLVLLSFNLYPILITVFGAMPCGEQTQHRPASHWIQSPESRPLTVEPQGATRLGSWETCAAESGDLWLVDLCLVKQNMMGI